MDGVAAAVVGDIRSRMSPAAGRVAASLAGIPFTKMTGSGNDFVVFNVKQLPPGVVMSPELVGAICHRGNGIGADGVVLLEPRGMEDPVGVRYFNRDGSEGALCGNATLCSTALASAWGVGDSAGMRLATGDGPVSARMVDGHPAILLAAARDVRLGVPEIPVEAGGRAGFALVGVPHLVLTCREVDQVDVAGAGPGLRSHPAVGAAGANVNWVQPLPDGRWRYRTYERGVEGETLACGTGAVAAATLLAAWGLVRRETAGGDEVRVPLVTSSGRTLTVTLPGRQPAGVDEAGGGVPADRVQLAGEGRVVCTGVIGALW
jgi:diaminopimelate epimerase